MSYGVFNFYRGEGEYGIPSNKKVWVLREFKNSEANKLGMPLPKGRLRFYQQDDDTSLQFIGENEIDHTAKDETIRVYVGNSFDLVITQNETAKSNHGKVCSAPAKATVTGTVSEEAGKKLLTASAIRYE